MEAEYLTAFRSSQSPSLRNCK